MHDKKSDGFLQRFLFACRHIARPRNLTSEGTLYSKINIVKGKFVQSLITILVHFSFDIDIDQLLSRLYISAPHQPRLDWQMWFAALRSYEDNPWFVHLVFRLLQGQRDVLDLLAKNPFPDRAPAYIRAKLYKYHYTELPRNISSLSDVLHNNRLVMEMW